MQWYFRALGKYAVFTGRARRREYWIFHGCNALAGAALLLIDGEINTIGGAHKYWLSSVCFILAIVLPSIAVSVRRLHDVNASGWWLVTALVPPVFMMVVLAYLLRDSDPEQNRYGPNPKTDLAGDALQTQQRRVRKRVLALLTIGLILLALRYQFASRAQTRREAYYYSTLQEYSQALKPGVTRKEVEHYLRQKNAAVEQMCCIDPQESSQKHALDDRTKIGEETAPWLCTGNDVFVAFQFGDREQMYRAYGMEANDQDVLKRVTLSRSLRGCL